MASARASGVVGRPAGVARASLSLARRSRALIGAALLAADPGLAGPAFDPAPTATCVAAAEAASPARGGHGVLDCAGLAAQACMAAPGGGSTLGMRTCLEAELAYWQDRLDAAQVARAAATTGEGAEADARIAARLQAMQAAWAAFRDAACLYEQAQWLGGSGAGPATAACHLRETARQALRLEGWWGE
jgi:uncharacterized protein YecT (DUF1311 family)